MGRSRLTLGTVPFLNARPLTLALEDRTEVALRVAPPTRLAELLAEGALEGALVSSYALFHMPGARYAPGVGIVSRGPVESIRLYCRKPADALERVGLDSWSLAGANMARVLLKQRWGAAPEFIPIDPERPPREDPSIDAFLLIGDNALREPPGEFYVLDLGDEWTAFTRLPFVYALWVFRPGAGDAAAARLLAEARDEGVGRLEEIIARAGGEMPFLPPEAMRAYLTECIGYAVGPEEEAGLRRYYDYLVEDGLAPPGWRPARLGEPARLEEEGAGAGGGAGKRAAPRVLPRPEGGASPPAEEAADSTPEADELCFMGLHELSGRIRRGEVSPVEVAEAHLRRIEALNPALFAYLTVTAEAAMAQAREAEEEIAAGRWRGPMHGMPYGAKDIVETAGILTTHGSAFHRDNVPAGDAEIIARLKGAGAVLLGKLNTHEFAAASTTINPHYGTTRNPWNLARIVGGSSGGSAAAVAAGLAPCAIGTDTGGSIRTPAALCGVVGLKPTHGRVSLRGICPNVLSLDHPGPMARSARDAALMLQVMAGYDPLDPMSRDAPASDYAAGIGDGVEGRRVVVCPDFYGPAEVDAGIQKAFERAVEVFRGLGAAVEHAHFPHFQRLVDLFPKIAGPEFAEFHRPFFEKDPGRYGEDVRERLEWSFQISTDEYVRALRERVLLQREAAAFFRGVDVMIGPALPCAAPPIESLMARINGREVRYAYLHRPFISPHNVTGFPALVTPMGWDGEGLPLALQIVGGPWREAGVLRAAHAYEQATPELRGKRPPCA